MPPLSLALWEIPEGMPGIVEGPAHAVRSIPWEGGNCDFLFRRVELSQNRAFVFARPVESQDEGNWVLCQAISLFSIESQGADEDMGEIDPDPVSYIEEVVGALCSEQPPLALARFVVVNVDGEEQYALLTCSGRGTWLHWATLKAQVAFEFLPPNLVEDGGVAFDWLNRELADEQSVFRSIGANFLRKRG